MSYDPTKPLGRLNRRQLLKSLAIAGAGGAAGLSTFLSARRGYGQEQPKPRFLIVLAGAGGASMIDSFLAIRQSEAGAAAPGINCFPDQEVVSVPDSPFRAVNLRRNAVGAIPVPFQSNQSNFVTKHKNDLMVVTQLGTSVNHAIAQKRAISGGGSAWNGRTLQEAVANYYGSGFPLPNVNMANSGYLEPGVDRSIHTWAFAEPVAQAALWPLSLDGSRGIKDAPLKERIAKARALRDGKLEPESAFDRTFKESERLKLWKEQRLAETNLEAQDLITKLNVYPDLPPQIPLNDYGLSESPDGDKVRLKFPDFATDPLEAQAALAFLLIKNRVSVTVTISPSFNVLLDTRFPPKVVNPPLAFDFSHQSHRAAQAVMWGRLLGVADRLIDLLKAEEFEAGQSYWDRSMIYIASDFGRTKRRPNNSDDFGSSHDLNNGFAILSPMANGNKVLGGVDPTTALTYGFDPENPQGVPDPAHNMSETQIYAGILHAMGVDTSGSGLPDMRAMRKNA